jgi:peptide deformylase
MSLLPLIIFPNPLLKETSKEVEAVDKNIQKLMDDMVETMYKEKGVGLAAVQVGQLKRILVMDVDYELGRCDESECSEKHITGKNPIFMVNPKIIESSKEVSSFFEGCLSFPEIRAEIKRPQEVEVEYLDYDGKSQRLKADDLLATCIQHELDHLNGITFVDYLSKLKRDLLLKKLRKILNS